ncbi:uncharacterized protein IWZ02DRAFT_209181 [Phyllosticta citriasiana]|uniref:uncharacterized protein n=1 Tax=Phyllosticta citriasiana TaxID=595635 RepID=UPI0030FD61F9
MADEKKSTQSSAAKNAPKSSDPPKSLAGPSNAGNPEKTTRYTNDRRPFISNALKRRRETMGKSRSSTTRPSISDTLLANRINTTQTNTSPAAARPFREGANGEDENGNKRKKLEWADEKAGKPGSFKLNANAAPFTPLSKALRYPPWNRENEPIFDATGARFYDNKWGRARTKYREWYDLSSYPAGDREFDHVDPKIHALVELAVDRVITVPVMRVINNALKHDKKNWADPDESKRAQFAKTGPPGLHRSAGGIFGGNSSNSSSNSINNRNNSKIWGGESEITKKEILDLWDAGARARRERESRGAGFYDDVDDGDFEGDDGVLIFGPNDGGFAGVGGQEEEEEEEEDDGRFGGLDSAYGPGFWRWN